MARLVLKHNRDAAPLVLAGTMKLAVAYAEAVVRRDRVASHGDRFERLTAAAPDLAAKVVDEELTLDEAEHEPSRTRRTPPADQLPTGSAPGPRSARADRLDAQQLVLVDRCPGDPPSAPTSITRSAPASTWTSTAAMPASLMQPNGHHPRGSCSIPPSFGSQRPIT